MFKAPQNYILVEIEKKFQDSLGNIVIDTTWAPEEHATLEGIVVSPPVRLKSDGHRTVTGSVKKGDKIFFSYSVIFEYRSQPDNDTPVYKNIIIHEGKEYWRVHAGEAFCIIEDDKYKMVTDNVLIEPLTQDSGYVKAKPYGDKTFSYNVRDIVCFEPKFVQQYNISGEEVYILPGRRIMAKVNGS